MKDENRIESIRDFNALFAHRGVRATTTVTRPCPFCGTVTSVTVDAEALAKRNAGALIQDAFPNLNPGDREFLITGLCLPCQGDVFEGEEA